MSLQEHSDERDLDPADTARIDRRGTVLAQLEAALLADRLEVQDTNHAPTGRDPYDRTPASRDVWAARRR